jgi:hypothetical protein
VSVDIVRDIFGKPLSITWVISLIDMQTIFRPEPQSGYAPILLNDTNNWPRMGSINFDAIGKSWVPLQFNFYSDEADEKKEPDIAVVVPGIAIRKGLAEQGFLDELSHVELLPITVSGQE